MIREFYDDAKAVIWPPLDPSLPDDKPRLRFVLGSLFFAAVFAAAVLGIFGVFGEGR